jgi:hypothetical protein
MTFAQMKKLEPKLTELETLVKSFDRQSCTISFWYREIKPPLLHIIGWGRGDNPDDPLATSKAYNLAYGYLFALLPDCNPTSCEDCTQTH